MVSELFVSTFYFPQVVAHNGSGLGAPEDASRDDRWFHEHLVASGQGLLGFPWAGQFPEFFRVRRVEVEGCTTAVGPIDAVQ